jgi:hypothetical protein
MKKILFVALILCLSTNTYSRENTDNILSKSKNSIEKLSTDKKFITLLKMKIDISDKIITNIGSNRLSEFKERRATKEELAVLIHSIGFKSTLEAKKYFEDINSLENEISKKYNEIFENKTLYNSAIKEALKNIKIDSKIFKSNFDTCLQQFLTAMGVCNSIGYIIGSFTSEDEDGLQIALWIACIAWAWSVYDNCSE